ncbi:Ig-like domain-containing protein [candidate division KSB1 bacterium]|nr:Ig-like domain-containing protein [candidate division KSB1 bacterium]
MRNLLMPIKQVLLPALIAGLGITLQSCTETPTQTLNVAQIEGRVVDKATSAPIEKALVKALPFNRSTETGAGGKYALSIELPDTISRTVKLVISKTGFANDSLVSLTIKKDRVTSVAEIKLSRLVSSGEGSGNATNIVLIDVTTSSIFVKGSGGQATSKMTFEVRDAHGVPVDTQHSVTVNFKIAGGLGGGEVLNPASAETDANGRVSTIITSGTKAGAVQVVAQIKGTTITAAPVPIAIHGGLPDLSHFSLAFEKLNFAGWIYYGLENKITAFVGDKYSNPVPPGTVVQFSSSGGIIGGSAVTDALGRASIILTSASPRPQGIQGIPRYTFPFTEPGFALIIAETVNENGVKIKTDGPVLFSGGTMPIEVAPTTFNLAPYSSQFFTYKVKDQNNNPLVAGTTISVTVDNGKLNGDTNINLKDTQSRAWTQFGFTLTNAEPDSLLAKDATIKIQVTSQNGDASRTIVGRLLPKN